MHRPAQAGLVAVGAGAVTVVGLDVARFDEVNPLRRTISEHGLGPGGWVFALAVGLLAAGSLAIGLSLLRGRLAGALGAVALAGWSAGLLITAWFPKHDWSVGPSVSGDIHRMGSVLAFLSLPVAALLISGRWLRHPEWRWPARAVCLCGLGALLWVAGIAAAVAVAAGEGVPWWRAVPLGLVERGLAGTEVAAVVAMGLWALRLRRRAGTAPGPGTAPRAAAPAAGEAPPPG